MKHSFGFEGHILIPLMNFFQQYCLPGFVGDLLQESIAFPNKG